LADPQKTLKRLSSLSRGERFRSVAVFAPSVADFDASDFAPSGDGFGAGWEFFSVSSACPEIGERTAVVFWLFTSKPSRLVDLGSSCCFTSYGAIFSASLLRPAKYQTWPFKLLLLNLTIRAQFGALCKFSKTVQLPRHVAAAKEP
jgi:hypothetical protein